MTESGWAWAKFWASMCFIYPYIVGLHSSYSPTWLPTHRSGGSMKGAEVHVHLSSIETTNVSMGWGANLTQYIFSPEMSSCDCACTGHGSLATCSLVINTAGLHNDYTFRSGLQAQEIWLGSPDCFPCERCGLGMRLVNNRRLVYQMLVACTCTIVGIYIFFWSVCILKCVLRSFSQIRLHIATIINCRKPLHWIL